MTLLVWKTSSLSGSAMQSGFSKLTRPQTATIPLVAAKNSSILSVTASVASLLAALSCCLPLGTLLLAAGSATASIISEKLRPWLLALSAGFLLLAFVQTYWLRRCEFRRRRARTLLLWFACIVVVSMLAFPRFTSTLLAGHLPAFSGATTLADFDEGAFARDFDAGADKTRIVVLLSPT